MSSLQTTITAPNGRVITLSTGLFIGNEFVKGSGNGIETIDPA
jgi:aldehyde dehydrogenase (NAD+)